MASIRSLEPGAARIAEMLIRYLASVGIGVTVTSTRRDLETQRRLYDCYKRTGCNNCRSRPGERGCFPAAEPGKSQHDRGLAFDLKLTPDTPAMYQLAGQLWESLGLTWGGRFNDPIHFDFRRRAR